MKRLVLAFILLASVARAEPLPQDLVPDIEAVPEQATYTIRAEWRDGYAQVCFFQEFFGNVMACRTSPVMAGNQPAMHPQANVMYVEIRMTLVSQGEDVSIRAYAIDLNGRQSPDSPNRANVDFTTNGGPFMLP